MGVSKYNACMFYEGWCDSKDVENAYKRVEKLVKEIASRIKDNIDK